MQSGNVAATVVDTTIESHYSYQQQEVSQQISSQQNQTQNQIIEQHQSSQVQDQIQCQNQITHQQVLRQLQQQQSQQPSNQASQVIQQVHDQQSQTQINQHLQQIQRHQRNLHHLEKHQQPQHIHVNEQGEFPRNIILKTEDVNEQQQQQQQQPQIQIEVPKVNDIVTNQQTYTTVQATPEVLFSLGFKEALAAHVPRDDSKELKDFPKSADAISRTVSNIPEYIRIRSGQDHQTPLVTVNSQAIAQTAIPQQQRQQQQLACRECGKIFSSLLQSNQHDCKSTILNAVIIETKALQILHTNIKMINFLIKIFCQFLSSYFYVI